MSQKPNYGKLEKRIEEFRSLIEKFDDIIWATDMELRIVYISSSLERKLGFTQKERMAQKMEETMTPESLQRATEAFIRFQNQHFITTCTLW